MIYFLGLFVVTLLVGMTPMEVGAGLLALVAIFQIIRRKGQGSSTWALYWTGFEWLLLLWIAVVAIGLAMSGAWEPEWTMRLLEFKWIIFLYLLVFTLFRSRLDDDVVLWIAFPIIAAGLYTVVISFLGFDPIKGVELEAMGAGGVARSGGLYSHAMTLAHCYSLIFFWFFGPFLFYFRFREKRSIWFFLCSLAIGLAVLFTFTRGVWGALGVAMILTALIFSRRLGMLFLVAGVLTVGAMYEFWPSFQSRMDQTFSSHGYDQERIDIWKANIEIFKDHPIMGIGYGENARYLPEYYEKLGMENHTLVSHAHNQYLHLLAGTGVVGLLIYLLVIGAFLRLSFKAYRAFPDKELFKKGLSLGTIGAQFCFILGGLTEANFEHAKFKYVLVMTWALVVWLAYESRVLREKL